MIPTSSCSSKRTIITALTAAIAVVAAVMFLYTVNPEQVGWLPRCLFHEITGLPCPSCGTTRALHALLHGEVARALHFNPMIVVMLPTAALYIYAAFGPCSRTIRLRRALYSTRALVVILAFYTIWWAIRIICHV